MCVLNKDGKIIAFYNFNLVLESRSPVFLLLKKCQSFARFFFFSKTSPSEDFPALSTISLKKFEISLR